MSPHRWHGPLNIFQHALARDRIELHMATGREERESSLNLLDDRCAAPAQKGLKSSIVTEFSAVLTDEIENRAHHFSRALPETASELLQEKERAVSRSQHQQRINGWHVDAFVEEVD